MSRPEKPLTQKQEEFCLAYMKNGGNASAAYRTVFDTSNWADKSVWERASVMLLRPDVASRIAVLREAAATIAEVSEAQVIAETANLALSDIGDLFDAKGQLIPLAELPRSVRAAIASVKIVERKTEIGATPDGKTVTRVFVSEVKLWDKNSALEKLMKHMGSFEKDNRQRAGIFDKLAKGEVELIVARLKQLARPVLAGQLVGPSTSRTSD